jgi:hypothetical protein
VAITNPDTRKRLIINRHIAKMSPEEIARRFSIFCDVENSVQRPEATEKQRARSSRYR